MTYQHLTAKDRSQIYTLLSKHYSINAIGKALKRSHFIDCYFNSKIRRIGNAVNG